MNERKCCMNRNANEFDKRMKFEVRSSKMREKWEFEYFNFFWINKHFICTNLSFYILEFLFGDIFLNLSFLAFVSRLTHLALFWFLIFVCLCLPIDTKESASIPRALDEWKGYYFCVVLSIDQNLCQLHLKFRKINKNFHFSYVFLRQFETFHFFSMPYRI